MKLRLSNIRPLPFPLSPQGVPLELRRPLTAAAAASVLIALMFVPSASATPDLPGARDGQAGSAQSGSAHTGAAEQAADGQDGQAPQSGDGSTLHLAQTGSIDTDPYVLAGTAFLGVGAGLVLFARRRERLSES